MKRIVKLTKDNNGFQCLLCCEREATVKLSIDRVKYDEIVISMHICNKCLVQMQKEIEVCE